MQKFFEWCFWIGFSFFPTIVFHLIRSGWIRFDGWPYNNPPNTTIILLFLIAIDSVKFLFVLKWKTRWFAR